MPPRRIRLGLNEALWRAANERIGLAAPILTQMETELTGIFGTPITTGASGETSCGPRGPGVETVKAADSCCEGGILRRGTASERARSSRAMYEHWARGDFPASFLDPDVEHSRIGAETPDMEGDWRGIEGLSRAMAEYLHAFSDLRIEAERIIDLDDDRVLVLSRHTARGKLSGVPIHRRDRRSIPRCARARWCARPPTGIVPTRREPSACPSRALGRGVRIGRGRRRRQGGRGRDVVVLGLRPGD